MRNSDNDGVWLAKVWGDIKNFCEDYSVVYSVKKRERAAAFEIGCLHMLVKNYEQSSGGVSVENLNKEGEFRYLTTPSGNPDNFSWLKFSIDGQEFQIRQQVRIKSHWHSDIAFCPDIVVLKPDAEILDPKLPHYANGKNRFFHVFSSQVVSAHECKSLTPFPELLVSFVGMFGAAHEWYNPREERTYIGEEAIHPAPCLFIGGDTNGIQRKMAAGLEETFPINIVTGLHFGQFRMDRDSGNNEYEIRYLNSELISNSEDIGQSDE